MAELLHLDRTNRMNLKLQEKKTKKLRKHSVDLLNTCLKTKQNKTKKHYWLRKSEFNSSSMEQKLEYNHICGGWSLKLRPPTA